MYILKREEIKKAHAHTCAHADHTVMGIMLRRNVLGGAVVPLYTGFGDGVVRALSLIKGGLVR